MEATGHYWLSVYTYLHDLGYPLVVINPLQTDAFHKFSIRKAKTDPIDAKLIANIIRTHNYEISSFAEENIFALRQLSRYSVICRISWPPGSAYASLSDRHFILHK
jgi:transposase